VKYVLPLSGSAEDLAFTYRVRLSGAAGLGAERRLSSGLG
jgi:hypothetical protein